MSLLEWIAVNHFKHSTCAFMFIRDLRHIHVAHLARCHSRSLTRHTDISRITSSFHGCISCGLPPHNHKSLKKSHKLNLYQLISTPPCSVFGMLQSSQFHTHLTLVEMAKWSTKDSYSNPLSLLEPLLLVPLLKENEKVFRPSVEEVKRAQDMFRPERGRCIEPMKGVIHFTDLPDPRLPEVCTEQLWIWLKYHNCTWPGSYDMTILMSALVTSVIVTSAIVTSAAVKSAVVTSAHQQRLSECVKIFRTNTNC